MRLWWLECRRALHFRSGRWGGESRMPGMLEARWRSDPLPRRIVSAARASHCVAHDVLLRPRIAGLGKAAIDIAAACSSAPSQCRSPRGTLSHPMHASTPPRPGEASQHTAAAPLCALRRTMARRRSPPRTQTRRWAVLSVAVDLRLPLPSMTFTASQQTLGIALMLIPYASASRQGSQCFTRDSQQVDGVAAVLQHAAMEP